MTETHFLKIILNTATGRHYEEAPGKNRPPQAK
jgi:hypothetical protein